MTGRYSLRSPERPTPAVAGTMISWTNARTRDRMASCSGARVKSMATAPPEQLSQTYCRGRDETLPGRTGIR